MVAKAAAVGAGRRAQPAGACGHPSDRVGAGELELRRGGRG